MAYQEFPEIPCGHIERCEAAREVADRIYDGVLVGTGHPLTVNLGTYRTMALEAISADCDPSNCVLGGLEGVLATVEEVSRHENGLARSSVGDEVPVRVRASRSDFWGDEFDDGGEIIG